MAGSPCDTLGIDGPVVDVASPEENRLQLKVWPNPFHERLAISLSAGLPNPVFRLYDMTGRLMFAEGFSSSGINEIETDGIEAGIYFWQVNTGHEKIKTGKLVKYER